MKKEYAEYLLEKTKQGYNQVSMEFSRVREKPWPEFKFLIDDYLISGEKVLDLGCGNGRLLEFLKEKEVDYIGVDNSERLIEFAKKKYPPRPRPPEHKDRKETFLPLVRFQVADALKMPFPNNYFDKIYSIATFHHIPSEEFRSRFLKEAKRVLKPEGILILTVWNLWRSSPKRKTIYKFILLKILGFTKMDFKDILMPWQGISQCYFHCFTKKELERIVKKAGFKIKDSGEIVVSREKRPNYNSYIVAEKTSKAPIV